MSVFKQKNALSGAVLEGFGGIDGRHCRNSLPSAFDMTNFKLCEDGSLEKRCGFVPVVSFSSGIRAVWSGKLDGCERVFIVHSNTVRMLDVSDLSSRQIGNIGSGDGHANFIFFDSALYLFDTVGTYLVKPDGIRAVEGYAPLYAKDWPSATVGEVNEPINLLSRRIRMSYTVTEPNIYLRVEHEISDINAVYVNGIRRTDSSSYYFDNALMCVCVLNMQVGDKVELYLTLSAAQIDRMDELLSCRHAFVYGGSSKSRFFLWGSPQSEVIYGSSDIDEDSYVDSKKVYSDSMPLYVKQSSALFMGREKKKISAVCRHYDRLLIFTEDDTWMVREPGDNGKMLDAVMVNSSYGCTSECGAIMLGNDPISISNGTVLKWTTDTDELDECNAHSISAAIGDRLSSSFFRNAVCLADRKREAVYFSDPTDPGGTLWIYSATKKCWYKYDGIGAELLLEIGDRIAFTRDKALYIFDSTKEADLLADTGEREITAYFETLPQHFSAAQDKKRLLGMSLDAEMKDSSLCVEYLSHKKLVSSVSTDVSGMREIHERHRLNSPRFNCLSIRLTSTGRGKLKIFSTGVWIKP